MHAASTGSMAHGSASPRQSSATTSAPVAVAQDGSNDKRTAPHHTSARCNPGPDQKRQPANMLVELAPPRPQSSDCDQHKSPRHPDFVSAPGCPSADPPTTSRPGFQPKVRVLVARPRAIHAVSNLYLPAASPPDVAHSLSTPRSPGHACLPRNPRFRTSRRSPFWGTAKAKIEVGGRRFSGVKGPLSWSRCQKHPVDNS